MARVLGALVLQLQADTKRLERDLGKARSRVNKLEGSMKGAAKRINGALAGIGVGIGVGVFVRLTKQAIDFGDQIQKTAIRTGLTTEAISELSFVAERGGTSLDAIIKVTQKVQRAAIDASDGLKTYTRAFDRLGIDVEAFKTLAPDRQFEVIADRISKLENPTERTAVAMQLLGRQGAEMISVFAGGVGEIQALREEAKRLGVSLTQDAADKAAEAADQITNLQTAIKGASLSAATDMLPAISAMAKGFQEVLLPTLSTVTTGVVNFVQFLGGGAAAILNDGLTIRDVFDDLQNRFDNLKPPETIRIPTIVVPSPGDLAQSGSGGANSPTSSKNSAASKEKASAAIVLALRDELALSKALTEEEKFRVSLTQGRVADLVGADKALGVQLVNQIKASEAIAEKRQVALDLDEEREDLAKRVIAGLEEQVATYHLVTEAARLRFELEEGAYKGLDGLSKTRIADLANELDALEKTAVAAKLAQEEQAAAAKKTAEVGQQLGLTFSSAFEDAIVSGNSFRDVLDGIAKDILRITARKFVTEPLAEGVQGLLKGIFGGPKAAGGPVQPGKAFLVGEKGPELFVPNTAGRIDPNVGGGVNITVVNNGAQVEVRDNGVIDGVRQLDILVEGAIGRLTGSGRLRPLGLTPGMVGR